MPNAVAATSGSPSTAEECLACHHDPDLAQSTHKGLTCAGCHAGISESPHTAPPRKVRCGACHRKSHDAISGSAHAKLGGGGPSASCIACHGSHRIQKIAADGGAICVSCHGRQAKQMAAGIHAGSGGGRTRNLPTCATCHTAHAVKSHRDPVSPTHRSQIHDTCARCHADPKVIAKERIARP